MGSLVLILKHSSQLKISFCKIYVKSYHDRSKEMIWVRENIERENFCKRFQIKSKTNLVKEPHQSMHTVKIWLGAVHKWRHGLRGEGVSRYLWQQYYSLINEKGWWWGEGCQESSKTAWRHSWTTPQRIFSYFFKQV